MKKLIVIAGIILIIVCFFVSCGHWDGSNPVGVTGGGANGYGTDSNFTGDDGSNPNGGTVDARVVGDWYFYSAGYYYYYTFQEDGDLMFVVEDGYDIIAENNGTYSANGTSMVIRIGGSTSTYAYQIQNNKLYLTDSSGHTLALSPI